MLNRCLCFLLSFTVLLQNSSLLAGPQKSKKQVVKEYKQAIYQAFAPVKNIEDSALKREYLENIIGKISEKLDGVELAGRKEKEVETITNLQNKFKGWKTELAEVEDADLDAFAEQIIEETEQAFVVALVVSIIVVIVIIAIIVGVTVKGGGRFTVRTGPRRPWFRRGPRFRRAPRFRRPGVHIRIGGRR